MLRRVLSQQNFGNFIVQQHRTAVNFFQRRREQVLWNTITAIKKHGMRKGGGKFRQPYQALSGYYKVGTIKASKSFNFLTDK
jgi:hypothetical protein